MVSARCLPRVGAAARVARCSLGCARGERAGPAGGGDGHEDSHSPSEGLGQKGPRRRGPRSEKWLACWGTWLALGTLTCASGSALFPHKLEGLVVVVVGTVTLSKYIKVSSKVVLARFGTCAR